MFTIQNAVRIALIQVVVIVIGVLGAGTSRRCWTAIDDIVPVPDSLSSAFHYGPFALLIPMIWIFMVLVLRQRSQVSDDAKNLAFWAGLALIGLLVLWFGTADVSPWLGRDWNMNGPPNGANH